MNLKKVSDSRYTRNASVKIRTGKKQISDSKGADRKDIEELISLYNKLQNDETVSKKQAVNALKKLAKKFPGISADIEVIEDGDEWYIAWGNVSLGYDQSSELWEVLNEVIGTSQYEMDVAAPNNSDPDAEQYWDEYRDSIGKANDDITVIYGPWGSSDPTEVVAFTGDVADLLEEWQAVFVPKDNYFHSSGEMEEIILIGDKNELDGYLKEFVDSGNEE